MKNLYNKFNKINILHKYLDNASTIHTILSILFYFIFARIINDLLKSKEIAPLSSDTILAITFGFSLVGFTITQKRNKADTEKAILSIRDALKAKRIKTSQAADEAIKRRIQHAVNVKTTYFPNSNKRDDEQISNPINREMYEKWLTGERGKEWKEIVTPEEIFDPRYTNLGENISVAGKKNHYIHVLRHKNTSPNFALLDYGDGNQEVFWGWISSRHDNERSRTPYVFLSSEPELTSFFEELFEVLWDRKTWGREIHAVYQQTPKRGLKIQNDIVDKAGVWANMSIKNGSICTFGLYKIEVKTGPKNERGFLVNGYTFDHKFRIIEKPEHKSSQIAHYENKMFIEYGSKRRSAPQGYCFYEFQEPPESILTGFFSDHDSEERSNLVGRKVSNTIIPPRPLSLGDIAPADIIDLFNSLEQEMRQRGEIPESTKRLEKDESK